MEELWRDLGQRREDEEALVRPGVRQDEIGRRELDVIKEQEV